MKAKRVLFDSKQGHEMFLRARPTRSFLGLLQAYEPQINPYYCGVACTTILLNTLAKTNRYSQATLLNSKTDRVLKSRREIGKSSSKSKGLTLEELTRLLKYYRFKTKSYVADGSEQDETNLLRARALSALKSSGKFCILNFSYPHVGVPGGGHFAIVGAYDRSADSILLMDVAFHKTGWWWVRLADIYRAMHTVDGDGYRGYLIVSRSH